MFNDIEFHIKTVLLANKIAYYPKILYNYNKTGHPSLQTSYFGKKEAMAFYDVMVGVRDFIIENGFMDEFRLDFLNYSFRHFYSKIKEMDANHRDEYFLKIKSFFESILITSDEFNQMSFRNLPIFIHMVNSNSYEEYELRQKTFDMEILNPNKYDNLKDKSQILKEKNIKDISVFDEDYLRYDNRSDLNLGKHKVDCNNLYVMRLEDRLTIRDKELNDRNSELTKEIDKLNNQIKSLEKTKLDYYKIREDYRFVKSQNDKLLDENEKLKGQFSYKLKKLFR